MGLRIRCKILLMILACLVMANLHSPVATGEVAIDLSSRVDPDDDSEIFTSVMSAYFGVDPGRVRQLEDQYGATDDLAVVLFLSASTGKSPQFILTLHDQGLGWWDISQGMNVNPNEWFIPTRQTPRPPFSEIYRNWTAAGQSGENLVLSDRDCQNLVAAAVLHRFFEVTLARAMEMRTTGRDLMELTAEEYRRRLERDRKKNENNVEVSAS